MRAILSLGLSVLFLLTAGLAADDKKDEKIDAKKLLGKWQPAEAKKAENLIIEFAKDGKLSVSAEAEGKDTRIPGSYKLDGNKLTLALVLGSQEQKETLTVLKLTDEELSTEDSKGKKETLKRVKQKK
jgi:uncharacterized protein (TIGR03066 family)